MSFLMQSCEQKGVIFSRGFELDYGTVPMRIYALSKNYSVKMVGLRVSTFRAH